MPSSARKPKKHQDRGYIRLFSDLFSHFMGNVRKYSDRFFFFFNDTATTEIYTLSYTTLFRSGDCRRKLGAFDRRASESEHQDFRPRQQRSVHRLFIVASLWIAPHLQMPVYALAYAVIVGGILQLAVQIPALARLRMLPKIGMNPLKAL